MSKHIKLVFTLFFLITTLAFTPLSTAQKTQDVSDVFTLAKEPDIHVGIWSNQSSVLVSAGAEFSVVNGDTKQILGKYNAGERVIIALKDGAIYLNNNSAGDAKCLRVLLSNEAKGEQFVEVNKRRYRGAIEVQRIVGKKGITVVNILPMEQYLYGIIANEISPEWAIEAVKAQAVAARSYALYSLYNSHKHQQDGYDVCATSDCQVYGGRESEALGSIKAVNATAGQVMLYQGKPIQAFFFNNSGGYTENIENVWGSYIPYLRGVIDYDQSAPKYRWEAKFSVDELNSILKSAGYSIGSLQAIELSPLTTAPMHTLDRGISGRVNTLRFLGTDGSVKVTGNKVRSLLALNSTLFDIALEVPVKSSVGFTITDSSGDKENKKIELNLPPSKERTFLTNQPNVRHITGRFNEIIVFSGFGWGHGVGMSQWGAKAMADKAVITGSGVDYYKTILKHYYQGISIQKVY